MYAGNEREGPVHAIVRDMTRHSAFFNLEEKLAINTNPTADAAAMRLRGDWYALQGVQDWAILMLEQNRNTADGTASLTLARAYWMAGNVQAAAAEFRRLAAAAADPREQGYLRLCLSAIEKELK
jgi:hypothetical protein